jgi:hypothetical protein
MGFADRCTPSGVGLGATRRRPLHGCQGIGHLQLDVGFKWCGAVVSIVTTRKEEEVS